MNQTPPLHVFERTDKMVFESMKKQYHLPVRFFLNASRQSLRNKPHLCGQVAGYNIASQWDIRRFNLEAFSHDEVWKEDKLSVSCS
jgi:hypothetical protein